MPPHAPTLLVLVGLPGSGKSHFCKALQESWGCDRVQVVSQDEIGSRSSCEDVLARAIKEGGVAGNNRNKDRKGAAAAGPHSGDARARTQAPGRQMRGNLVILDRCNATAEDRARWLDVAFRPAKSVAVFFDVASDTCKARVAERCDHPTIRFGSGARQVDSFARQLATPAAGEGFSEVHIVRTFDEADALLLRRFGADPAVLADLAAAAKPGFFKFPRTHHLADLGGTAVTRDDLLLSREDAALFFSGLAVTVEEKIDGANLGITIDPDSYEIRFQNRSHHVTDASAPQFRGLERWGENRAGDLFAVLEPPGRYVLFGEWMRARHTVAYAALPDWFIAFDIFDRRRNRFLSRAAFHERLAGTGIAVVPELARDRVFQSLDEIVSLLRTRSAFHAPPSSSPRSSSPSSSSSPSAAEHGRIEGVYLRIDSRPEDDHRGESFLERRCKLVNPDFVQTIEADGHWSKRTMELNRIS